MYEKCRINSLIKEAEIYRRQGLLEESQEKYLEIFAAVKHREESPKSRAFIHSLQERIHDIKNEIDEIDSSSDTPKLSDEIQQLISSLFTFSGNRDIAAVEGAVALAEFGQYESALTEFQELLDKGICPMMVAKNIIRCHLSSSSPEAAIDQFSKWSSDHTFSDTELGFLRNFYHEVKGASKRPMPPMKEIKIKSPGNNSIDHPNIPASNSVKDYKTKENLEDILQISSISIEWLQGPSKDRIVEFEVAYQMGNTISFIVDSNDMESMEIFEPGVHLSCVHCFSSMSTFETSGVISERKKITSGPKKGNTVFRMILKYP